MACAMLYLLYQRKEKTKMTEAQKIQAAIQATLRNLSAQQAALLAQEEKDAIAARTIVTKAAPQFVELTRIYATKSVYKDVKKIVTVDGKDTVVTESVLVKASEKASQPITIALAAVATVRPSNRLGFPDHRSTVLLMDGTEIDLMEIYSTVKKALNVA